MDALAKAKSVVLLYLQFVVETRSDFSPAQIFDSSRRDSTGTK